MPSTLILEIEVSVEHLGCIAKIKCAFLKKGAIGASIFNLALSIREESESATEGIDSLSQAGMF